jgi:hypothetical protein
LFLITRRKTEIKGLYGRKWLNEGEGERGERGQGRVSNRAIESDGGRTKRIEGRGRKREKEGRERERETWLRFFPTN